jgi:hypothetical protein
MKSQSLLFLLTVALLTACGGGVYDPNKPAEDPTPPALRPDNNQRPSQDVPNSSFSIPRRVSKNTGMYNQFYYDSLFKIFESTPEPTTDESNTIITSKSGYLQSILRMPDFYANGKEGNVLIYGSRNGTGSLNKYGNLSYKTFQVSDNSYRHSQFGMYNTNDGYTNFWRGEVVSKLPSEGKATYRGDSIVGFLSDKGVVEKVEQGSALANVDFGTRQINVSLKSPGYEGNASARIKYDAKNQEATFATMYNKPYGINGKFAGANAEEVVGRLVDTKKNVDAVFGGKRQQ